MIIVRALKAGPFQNNRCQITRGLHYYCENVMADTLEVIDDTGNNNYYDNNK